MKIVKRVCWERFLQGESQSSDPPIDKNHYQTALKYIKPLLFRTTLVLKNSYRNTTMSMKAKETLVWESAFPKLLINLVKSLVTLFGSTHTKVNEEVVGQVLMTQAVTKAPNPYKINFQLLQLTQGWDKARITSMVYYAI